MRRGRGSRDYTQASHLPVSLVSEGDFNLALLSPQITCAGVCMWLGPLLPMADFPLPGPRRESYWHLSREREESSPLFMFLVGVWHGEELH